MRKEALLLQKLGHAKGKVSMNICEVLIGKEWISYDMAGSITPESKAWHKKYPVTLIAEGEHSVRFNGQDNENVTLCFYKKK